MIAPLGNARQRYGWKYIGSQTVAKDMAAVCKSSFALTSQTVVMVSRTSSNMGGGDATKGYIYRQDTPTPPATAAASAMWTNPRSTSTYWIPRCVYNGDLIFCAQDGESPMIRFAGSDKETTSTLTTNISVGVGSMTFTTSNSFTAGRGSFFTFRPTTGTVSKQPSISSRVIETDGATSFTLESVKNGTTSAVTTASTQVTVSPFGFSWPAVAIYEVGTLASTATSGPTFTGTRFTTIGINTTDLQNDALLLDGVNGGPFEIVDITGVTNDTELSVSTAVSNATGARCRVLRRSPFKDATVHKGALWGTGVKQYPNRVYVFPATRDIGLPPGAPSPVEIPYDAISRAGYANASNTGYASLGDYVAFSDGLDIPSRYDQTPIVALLSSGNPLLVLKPDAVYGIYGSFPSRSTQNLEINKISDGAGCIDLRSAVNYEGVPFWAGSDGIYTWRDNAVVDLTAGKIRQEWQALMFGYVSGTSSVTTGLVSGSYLVVATSGLDPTKTGAAKLGPDTGNPSSRTFVYDLRTQTWLGRMSNFSPTHMWTSTVEEGGEALLAVDGATHQGYVMDFHPALSGGTQADGDGTYPRLKAWTTASLAQAEGVEGEARFCDVIVHANLYDGTTPTSTFDISIVSGGSLMSQATHTKTLTPITADTVNRVDRYKRSVNRTGRLHQIRFDMSTTDSTNLNSEIPEIVMSFRDSRRGT
jgi:hypothetical protein